MLFSKFFIVGYSMKLFKTGNTLQTHAALQVGNDGEFIATDSLFCVYHCSLFSFTFHLHAVAHALPLLACCG